MRRFDKHIPILSGLGDWARLRLILGGSNEYPPATVSSYTVVVSHLAFGTLSSRSINAPRWRRSWNVWISCSQDGPQGSQHLIRFSVGHFALAQGNPWGDIVVPHSAWVPRVCIVAFSDKCLMQLSVNGVYSSSGSVVLSG